MKKEKHQHNFKHIEGGCNVGKVENEMKRCDDEYECDCGEKITVLCSDKIHFERKDLILKR